MRDRKPRGSFSKGWMIASIFAFSAMEVAIGGQVSDLTRRSVLT